MSEHVCLILQAVGSHLPKKLLSFIDHIVNLQDIPKGPPFAGSICGAG